MNYSTAVMLINENIRAIKTSYEPIPAHRSAHADCDLTIYKTLDKTVSVGDFVVIPTSTRHEKTVVRVEEVDCEVDFESSVVIDWIISVVNTTEIEKIQSEERKWIETLKASEKRAKREEIKRNMLAMHNDDEIISLPIASMGGSAEITDNTKD